MGLSFKGGRDVNCAQWFLEGRRKTSGCGNVQSLLCSRTYVLRDMQESLRISSFLCNYCGIG